MSEKQLISSYLDSWEPSEQHVSLSFKCFIRCLHLPLCSTLKGIMTLSLLPSPLRACAACTWPVWRWENMCVSEGVALFVQAKEPVQQLAKTQRVMPGASRFVCVHVCANQLVDSRNGYTGLTFSYLLSTHSKNCVTPILFHYCLLFQRLQQLHAECFIRQGKMRIT